MEKEERKAPRTSRNRAGIQHLFVCLDSVCKNGLPRESGLAISIRKETESGVT